MPKNTDIQFTKKELRRLLEYLDRLDDAPIVPLSNEEVTEIEAAYELRQIDSVRKARQYEDFEQLRQGWLADAEILSGLLPQVKAVGLSRSEFAERMRIDPSILLKLERRLLTDIPHRAIKQLADALQVSFRSVYMYLAQPAKDLDQMAASSRGKPGKSRTESWAEAIANSNMAKEDKAYWLSLEG